MKFSFFIFRPVIFFIGCVYFFLLCCEWYAQGLMIDDYFVSEIISLAAWVLFSTLFVIIFLKE